MLPVGSEIAYRLSRRLSFPVDPWCRRRPDKLHADDFSAAVAGHVREMLDLPHDGDPAAAVRRDELQLVPGQATFAFLMVEARLTTLRSCGSVVCRFRQAM